MTAESPNEEKSCGALREEEGFEEHKKKHVAFSAWFVVAVRAEAIAQGLSSECTATEALKYAIQTALINGQKPEDVKQWFEAYLEGVTNEVELHLSNCS